MEPKLLLQQRRGARGTARLGNHTPSCSGFEAEPLCWLQHSANRWQQDWHSQENPSCGGQRAAERERSSQTEGVVGEVEKGRGCGEGTLHSPSTPPPQAQPPRGAPRVSACVHMATSAHPSRGTQDLLRTLRGQGLARSPAPKGSQDTCLPLLSCYLHLPASSPLQLVPAGTGDT